MKKHIAAVFACLVVSFVVLDAHVIVTPRESAAGAEEVYTVSVPWRREPSPRPPSSWRFRRAST